MPVKGAVDDIQPLDAGSSLPRSIAFTSQQVTAGHFSLSHLSVVVFNPTLTDNPEIPNVAINKIFILTHQHTFIQHFSKSFVDILFFLKYLST